VNDNQQLAPVQQQNSRRNDEPVTL